MPSTSTKSLQNGGYLEAVGRRKTSVARARITKAARQSLTVNNKEVEEYFKREDERLAVLAPLATAEGEKFSVTVRVYGGGTHSQAEAVRHAISRALSNSDMNLRSPLKKKGFLTRDPRMKERRKFGLKKARKAPQWSKR